jgi:hypothetical protein
MAEGLRASGTTSGDGDDVVVVELLPSEHGPAADDARVAVAQGGEGSCAGTAVRGAVLWPGRHGLKHPRPERMPAW